MTMSTSTTPLRRRVAFELGGAELDGDGGLNAMLGELEEADDNNTNVLLDDQEQDEVLARLSLASEHSSMAWRLATLLLEAACFASFIFLPLPEIPHASSQLFKVLAARTFILFELFLGGLSSLTEFITSLPSQSSPAESRNTPSHPAAANHDSTSKAYKPRQSSPHSLRRILTLPPELSATFSADSKGRSDLALFAPLLLALASATLRTLLACKAAYVYTASLSSFSGAGIEGEMKKGGLGLGWHDALTLAVPGCILFISVLARSYAKELDKELRRLGELKYSNKGV